MGEEIELIEENQRMKKALAFYADPEEWLSDDSFWRLRFNSRHYDGHGYEIAKKALKKSGK